jgi:hypothetical protein
MSILDRIQKASATPAPAQSGIEKLLAAKKGKAGTGAGPGASALGEQAAIGATKTAGRQMGISERLQDLKLQGARARCASPTTGRG